MNLLLLALLAAGPAKSVEVRFTDVAPRIDGRIEDVWKNADTINDFVQSWPDEGSVPTETTYVYVLQDHANLYVLFRCRALKNRPVGQLYGMEEEATVFLDAMDSRSTAYFFKVYGSGLWRQGMILDNGTSEDWSWDCVWDGTSRLTADEFVAEMRIPFKSIRYKQGTDEWGINFHRFIATRQENDFWSTLPEREGGNRVSNYGRLRGINPRAEGYYFELFPEGFARLDQDAAGKTRVKPSASLNLKWDLTPQTTLNATVLPDFAQIEADPYQFNISRYESRLAERRPFFVEGSELFRMSGGNDNFEPLNIFYSRRIGKPVAGEPVPIISGLKLTTRSGNSSLGALAAVTDRMGDAAGNELEPRREFAVLSGKTRLDDNANLGLIFGSTVAGADNYNYALGGDWNFSTGGSQGAVQAALSDRNGRRGWALNSGYFGYIGKGVMSATFQSISDSFSVTDIGYVPWTGRTMFNVQAGPRFAPTKGALRRLTITPGLAFSLEPGTDEPSYGIMLGANPNFRNGWGGYGQVSAGHAVEVDTAYFGRSANFSVWGSGLKYNVNFGGMYDYSYNYSRGFLAANYSDWVGCTYYLAGKVALMLAGNNWWEANPDGRIIAVTSRLSPKIDYRINSRISFNVYDEVVLSTPELRFGETKPATNRVGFLFSWNFLPKSWLFVAFNELRLDQGEGLKLLSRVGAVKLRYLVYF